MQKPGLIDHELAIYILLGIGSVIGYAFKRLVGRIEKNYDKHLDEEKQSNKELWIEVNNLRERVATLEGGKK